MIRHHRRAAAVVALVTGLVLVRDVGAGVPTDQLRTQINRVVKTIEDPELRKESKNKERRTAVRKVADEIFDFTETAKRSLARHWQQRSPAERREFVDLFADLLERSYVSKIELYSGEKILYAGEVGDSDFVTVRTRIQTKQRTEIPVDYRMFRRGDRWRNIQIGRAHV